MNYPKNPDIVTEEQNKAIEKEIANLISSGVPEWQARETAAINLGIVGGDVIASRDPGLTDEQNAELDKLIEQLVEDGWSRHQAEEAAPIMMNLSDGDIVEE